jgi:wobble nucleotide-excising tRNase
MSQTLTEIAQLLKDSPKKVQLIYAFNGTGKTRLSRKFRLLVDPKETAEVQEEQEAPGIKVMYYNAFTEDLFYWDNDLDADTNRKLIIRPNNFTNFAMKFLKDEGQDRNIASNFQYYTGSTITPLISDDFSEVIFSVASGGDDSLNNIKISKGEESNFIWCVFYSLLQQVVDIRNTVDIEERSTQLFNDLEYIFIDDPVSSLDDSHLIELAVNIATLIKKNQSEIKFIITTHNPLFYNVIYNELNNKDSRYNYKPKFEKYLLEKLDDGTLLLTSNVNDSPFSYHMHLLSILKEVAVSDNIEKYHFNLLRNILEKTATFLGHKHWGNLITKTELGDKEPYVKRILNVSSHSKHSGEETNIITTGDKLMFKRLVKEISSTYQFNIDTEEIIL